MADSLTLYACKKAWESELNRRLIPLFLDPVSCKAFHRYGGEGVVELDLSVKRASDWLPQAPLAIMPQTTGDNCRDCGGFTMVRTGTCLTCSICGSTSGGCS